MSELRELREHIAFLQAEQKLCCQATPGLAAKRPRIKTVDPLAPHESSDPSGTESGGFNQESSSCTNTDQEAVTRTPVNGLSLILEEESELEGESPFERKLKLFVPTVRFCYFALIICTGHNDPCSKVQNTTPFAYPC